MSESESTTAAVALTGLELTVEFVPGQEFVGPVAVEKLLNGLRLSPKAAPVDLMQTPLHVWLNGDLIDVDDPIAVLGKDGSPADSVSASAGDVGGSIELYGSWLREWWPDVSDDLTLLPDAVDFTKYALSWAVVVVSNWILDGVGVDIDIESPRLSPANDVHVQALRDAAGEFAYLVALNGVIVDQSHSNEAATGAADAG